ncbi:MAG: DUF3108 domain-containing protein [Alphaproteobacteria bacterium]|nr:DUF3108 domain-containing protein [Alphaproteobacteria bacterium]
MPRPFGLIFGIICLLGGGPSSAGADMPVDLTLEYEAYFGGMHIASARAEIYRDETSYRIEGRARARGLLDWYSDWKGEVLSRGLVEDDLKVEPKTHVNDGVWRGEERRNRMTFRPDGTVDVRRDAPDDDEIITPVPKDSIPGSIDPITAILSLSGAIQKGGRCEGTVPVYDGRRRYDMIITPEGMKTFERNDYTVFSGEAMACRLEFNRIGGFREQTSNKYTKTAQDRLVWVASPFPGTPPVPVRLEVSTDYGTLIVHLTAARYQDKVVALEPDADNLADD